jgi:hypothetical protein
VRKGERGHEIPKQVQEVEEEANETRDGDRDPQRKAVTATCHFSFLTLRDVELFAENWLAHFPERKRNYAKLD